MKLAATFREYSEKEHVLIIVLSCDYKLLAVQGTPPPPTARDLYRIFHFGVVIIIVLVKPVDGADIQVPSLNSV